MADLSRWPRLPTESEPSQQSRIELTSLNARAFHATRSPVPVLRAALYSAAPDAPGGLSVSAAHPGVGACRGLVELGALASPELFGSARCRAPCRCQRRLG